MSLVVAALLMLAPQAALPLSVATPEAAPAKEKKTCRKEENSYSRMAKQTCHTKTEWAEIDKANGANADRLSQDSRLDSAR